MILLIEGLGYVENKQNFNIVNSMKNKLQKGASTLHNPFLGVTFIIFSSHIFITQI
jgi:hypothetical protein